MAAAVVDILSAPCYLICGSFHNTLLVKPIDESIVRLLIDTHNESCSPSTLTNFERTIQIKTARTISTK
jgi:hypothetical protein